MICSSLLCSFWNVVSLKLYDQLSRAAAAAGVCVFVLSLQRLMAPICQEQKKWGPSRRVLEDPSLPHASALCALRSLSGPSLSVGHSLPMRIHSTTDLWVFFCFFLGFFFFFFLCSLLWSHALSTVMRDAVAESVHLFVCTQMICLLRSVNKSAYWCVFWAIRFQKNGPSSGSKKTINSLREVSVSDVAFG